MELLTRFELVHSSLPRKLESLQRYNFWGFITIIYRKRQGESFWGKPNGLTYFYDNDILN